MQRCSRRTRIILAVLLSAAILNLLAFQEPALAKVSLDTILEDLTTKDTLARRYAREQLRDYLINLSAQERLQAVQDLINRLANADGQTRLGIGSALAVLPDPWLASDHEAATDKVYALLQEEPETVLAKTLDRALMNAAGLYFDAIRDYNADIVSLSVEGKFRRVFERYPASRYAPAAQFFLGVHLTRAYFLTGKTDLGLVKRSNAIYTDLIERVREGHYAHPTEHLLDAHFYRALNFVLLNDANSAIAELQSLLALTLEVEDQIYVYRFFPEGDIVVDRFFDAEDLTRSTLEFINANPEELASNIGMLARRLAKTEEPEAGEYFVIAASLKDRGDAEKLAQNYTRILEDQGVPAQATVFAPYSGSPYHAVVIGAYLSEDAAKRIRKVAIKAGLPRDTYLWRFPTQKQLK